MPLNSCMQAKLNEWNKKGGELISSLILPEKSFNPLHNQLPDFFNCHLKNGHDNELNNFPNRRSDFSLLGSLSAATKLPKALL